MAQESPAPNGEAHVQPVRVNRDDDVSMSLGEKERSSLSFFDVSAVFSKVKPVHDICCSVPSSNMANEANADTCIPLHLRAHA